MSFVIDGAPVPISLYTGGKLPPFRPGPLNFDYLLAGNGLFLRARQGGLKVVAPVSTLRGAPPLVPSFRWDYPLVPAWIVARMLELARQARAPDGSLVEILFYLTTDGDTWELHQPEQEQTAGNVTVRGEPETFARALIEVHSHGALRPYFSATDNSSEGLLRIYAVMGQVEAAPAILVRVGAYGVYQVLPAELIFDLAGTGLKDVLLRDLVDELAQEGEHGPVF